MTNTFINGSVGLTATSQHNASQSSTMHANRNITDFFISLIGICQFFIAKIQNNPTLHNNPVAMAREPC